MGEEYEQALGKRFFRGLTDDELIDWRPATPRGLFGWGGPAATTNVGAANREMRRRTAKAGMKSVYDWLSAKRPAEYTQSQS